MKKIILILLLLPSLCYGKFGVSICAIFRDDAEYLKEWIDFHLEQDVDHFYLYNNLSQDHYLEILIPYIETGIVTLIEWPHESSSLVNWNDIQCSAYLNCIKKYGKKTKWIAFIDTDEFLFCPDGKKLPIFLRKYKKYGGVGVNWVMFGTNNVEEIPKGKSMVEMLTKRAPLDYPDNKHIKSIIQPSFIRNCQNPHFFYFLPGKYIVDENFKKIGTRPVTDALSVNKIRINHYWTRTERFFRETKIVRNNWDGKNFALLRWMIDLHDALNFEDDASILNIPKIVPTRKDMSKLNFRL